MSGYFDNADAVGRLVAAASGWPGTPFRANSSSQGRTGGVCCHMLVYRIYIEAGLNMAPVPSGPPGHARFQRTSIMEPLLDASPSFVPVEGDLQIGDLLGYRIGQAIHHLAILLPRDQIIHAISGPGCVVTPRLDPTWASRHARTWRPIQS